MDPYIPDNPAAKVWELLRPNAAFLATYLATLAKLKQLDAAHRRKRDPRGRAWAESHQLIWDLQSDNPFAADALLWMVPEPLFVEHRGNEIGIGTKPNREAFTWFPVRPRGWPHRRGPTIDHRHGAAFDPIDSWRIYHDRRGPMTERDPWPDTPEEFRRLFESHWTHYQPGARASTAATAPLPEAAQYSIGPATAPSQAASIQRLPEFLRLPQPGQRCQLTGLTRSFMNDLILPTPKNDYKPPVRSFVLRKRGAQTGVRLIDTASLLTYIRQHEDTAASADTKSAP